MVAQHRAIASLAFGKTESAIIAEFVKIIKDVTMKINKLLVVFGFVTGGFTSELFVAVGPPESFPPAPSKQQMA